MTDPTPRLAEPSDADITLVREWLTDLDANIDNPYDTQMCNTVRAVLDEREQMRLRLEHIDILLPVLNATVAYGPTLENARRAVATIARALDVRAAEIAAEKPGREIVIGAGSPETSALTHCPTCGAPEWHADGRRGWNPVDVECEDCASVPGDE